MTALPKPSNWPVIAAVSLMLLLSGIVWLDNAGANGVFVYALDDAYIHLTISRTLADHGVWGVSPHEFVSASSSPLWTLLLALWHRCAGSAEFAPFLLNIVFSGFLLFAFDAALRDFLPSYAERPVRRLLFLCAVVLAMPMPALIVSGMEHILHTLLAILFVSSAARQLWPDNGESEKRTCRLCLFSWAALAVAARYETLFLAAPVVLILFWRREWMRGIQLSVAALAPVILFGIYSVYNGMTFIPASMLVKTIGMAQCLPEWILFTPLVKACFNMLASREYFVLSVLGVFAIVLSKRNPGLLPVRLAGICGVFSAGTVIHAELAAIGWFYRYEAYLIVLGMMTAVPAFVQTIENFTSKAEMQPARRAMILGTLVLLVCWPLVLRAANAAGDTPLAYRNIRDQQIQMARFLAAGNDGKVIALNDIGAVGYYTDTRILDLFGLASREVFAVRMRRGFSTASMDRLTRQAGAETAILTSDWFGRFGGIPASWTQVATWRIEKNIICASDTVTFYAVASAARDDLRLRLKEFSPRLPHDVTVTFFGETGK